MRLREHQDRVPARIARFMDNFFSTCHEYTPKQNFRNYVNDIDLYGATVKMYQTNRKKLIRAFYDITGTREGSFE